MRVSIVIPVYNVYPYLRECVESVLMLKTDVEIVLVDDGSKDNSGMLCDELAKEDPRILVIHQENGGLSKARNTGIENCSGEYVMFLDSDDFIDPEATENMLGKLSPNTDILVGLYRNYYSDGSRFENESCGGFLSVEGEMPVERFLEAVPKDGRSCYMVACRFVVRREFLTQNKLLFTEGIYHEDEEWTQRLLCSAETITVTHDYFYQYRQAREGAITSSVKSKHVWDIFTIMESCTHLLGILEPHSKKEAYLKNRLAQLYVTNMINIRVLERKDRNAACKKLGQYTHICNDSFAGSIGTCVKCCQKLFGIRVTCFLLRVARTFLKQVQ